MNVGTTVGVYLKLDGRIWRVSAVEGDVHTLREMSV